MARGPHPGETLREDVLPALGLTPAEAAELLGLSITTLTDVLEERAAITPEIALRLEDWLCVENGGRGP